LTYLKAPNPDHTLFYKITSIYFKCQQTVHKQFLSYEKVRKEVTFHHVNPVQSCHIASDRIPTVLKCKTTFLLPSTIATIP